MGRREQVAGRMADAVVRRLVVRKLADVRDESRAKEVVRRILTEDLLAEDKLDADARALLLDHAKEIKDSASDYRRLFALVKTKLAKERGFTL
jgi:hypothetical protein